MITFNSKPNECMYCRCNNWINLNLCIFSKIWPYMVVQILKFVHTYIHFTASIAIYIYIHAAFSLDITYRIHTYMAMQMTYMYFHSKWSYTYIHAAFSLGITHKYTYIPTLLLPSEITYTYIHTFITKYIFSINIAITIWN